MVLRMSGEDYLEAILVLKQKKGVVRSIDVAHHLNYSKPSVSRAVNNLKGDGYLEMQPAGELILTGKGRAVAETILERHTILTKLFVHAGVPEGIAAEDACKVEHDISEETFRCLKETYGKELDTSGKKPRDDKAEKADKDKKKKKKK